ncbi:hypothetical protein J7T55_012766 [Diaporthe amygdali]|uniref:uncharacterized protein n=1 Tax=Phomopsis amygdali TaxID=1214568 RepID=UPI0022FF3E0E|nr:uncharacterized protein J7T55_012766 [Diaporthe amygdali]KAJ0115486.1 hypothetical protein J7T55_012766 [Diaporthe amygdali]
MAAAEVLAFAASDSWHPAQHFTKATWWDGTTRGRRNNQVDALLQWRLGLISEAWIELRSAHQSTSLRNCPAKPLIIPQFCSPKCSRARRQPGPSTDHPASTADVRDLTDTDSAAQLRLLAPEDRDVPPPSSSAGRRQQRDDRDIDLLADPNMDLIDFDSEDGFLQAAGKKKKKQTTSFNWLEDENDKKDGDGTEEGGDGNKDPNGGDAGAGDGAGGDGGGDDSGKKEDDKAGADADADDIWGDFATVGSKKKKNKDKTADAFGLPEIPPTSTDFHEIKLDDSGGGTGLDFGLGSKTEKPKTGLSAWTSSWGGGGWGWGGLSGSQTEASKPAEEEKTEYPVDDSPWGINRPKPKKKTTSTFSFGAIGEDDGTKDSNSFDFLGGSKPSDKKDTGKKKKGKAVIDEFPAADITQEETPPEAPDAPQSSENAPEPALTPDEEAELLKLQTKKDIGSKLTKKQTDRYKFLTDKVEEASKAAEAASGDAVDLLDDAAPAPAADDPANGSDPFDAAQAEADENARVIQEEEEEMAQLRGKKKLKKAEKDRLRVLEDRADERSREAEEKAAAAESNGQEEAAPEIGDVPAEDTPPADDPAPEIDAAQAEADEQARIVQEEEEEMAQLRAKKKLKRADKDRLQELEDRAESRAREAEESAAAAQAEVEAAEAAAAQADADEKARIIQEEEEEMAQLRAKKKLKSADKERLRILEENADTRAREAQAAETIAPPEETSPESGAGSNESKSDETAPTTADDAGIDSAAQAETDEAARLIEEEENELEMLLSKLKLKKADKTRLKELQDNKERREQEAAAKADVAAAPDSSEPPVDGTLAPAEDAAASGDGVEPIPSEEDELAKRLIEEEELELDLLLSKSKLKKNEKARLKVLQDNKEQREYEAAAKAEAASDPAPDSAEPPTDGAIDSAPVLDDAPVDETAAQEALIAAEESELTDLLSKAKLKKVEKARLKELQDRKDQRDEEAKMAAERAEEEERVAREKAEQDARELEEQKRREEIEAEEAEIASLKSKKKLKRSEKDRLSELEFRAQERASAEAEKLAEELLKEDAQNDVKEESKASKGFSWADDDPAADENGAGDDWMDWGLSSSKKLKKKDKSSPLIEFGGTSDPIAIPDAPTAIADADSFDFGWGKPKKKDVQTPADDLWSFGGSSKKKSKNQPVEVVDDPIKPDTLGEPKDKIGGDDFWSTFGVDKKDKSSRKNALAMEPPPPVPTPPNMDLTETEVDVHDAGDGWDDPSGSTELSRSKSKSSDKDSKKVSKEPKLSKKELEKLEKEKKKAEKEQKEREKREAEEAAERDRIAEEERLVAEAKAEEERLVREAEELAKQEEEAKQAAIDAIAQEEADLAILQAKKDSGKKLTKKDKEKFDKLSASCQARADEKAAQEAAEQAAREEEERLAREAEELARRQEIEKEEAELQELQKKKDSGRKLLKKDKEKYDMLRANKKARDKAAEEAAAPKDEAAPAGDLKAEDDLDKDLANLDANQLDELDQFLSSPTKPSARAAEVDPFDFWGASKKSPKPKKGKSPGAEPLLEATTSHRATVENSASKDVVVDAWSAWQDTYPLSRSRPETHFGGDFHHHDLDNGPSVPASPPSPTLMKGRKSVGGKIADRLKAFEATIPPPPPAPVAVDFPPPPPPPPVEPVAPPAEDGKKKKKSKSKAAEIPGSFPVEEDEQLPDDIVEVIDMSPPKSKKGKKAKSKTEDAIAVPPPPPPPPAVPDAPLSPPPETAAELKREGKKERAKINRDGGSSWGMWSASTPSKEKKPSKSKAPEEPKREKKSRSPEKEERLSAPGSSSDKAERSERVKDMAKETPVRPKLMSVFNSTPPISRSMSTREKRHKEGKSSRRSSFDTPSGIVSPPPEDEVPTMSSKAAKILGVGIGDALGRSSSKRKKSSKPFEEDDIVMVGANDAAEPSPEKSSRRRHKQYPRDDDDIVMVDVADATPPPGLRRSNTSGSTKKGFGGLFGGMLSTPKTDPRPEPRRRNTHHGTDIEDGAAATDVDAEAKKAARRLRRAEREAAEKEEEDSRRAKDEARREKRRKQEEEEHEARRAERRAAKLRQEEERKAAEDKEAAREERRRQKRLERQQEREATAANGETTVEDDEARRAARRERRKGRAAESDREQERRHPDEDEERRRRRAERRAARESAEGKSSSRRRAERADDGFGRPSKISRRHTDGLDKSFKKSESNPNPWPHSGTSSWVKDHSDAGPPPEDGVPPIEAMEDMDDAAARHERRRRRKYGDGVVDVEVGDEDGERRRRKRREERAGGSDGSGERKRHSIIGDAYATATPRSSASSWWKKLKGT